VGKNSKAKRDAKRRMSAKAYASRRSRDESQPFAGIPIGMTAEDSSVFMLTAKWDSLDPAHDGSCPGPVILHEDGAFECHGTCESAMSVWHEAHNGGTRYCPGGIDNLRNACPRCFGIAAGSADLIPMSRCMGTELDHLDGTTTCTEGAACPGGDVVHVSGMSCSLAGPCAHCATG
jgi:hypothetical protein